MGFLDNIFKKKLKEQTIENKDKETEEPSVGRIDLSKKIGLNFSKLNLDKEDVRTNTLFLLDVSGSMDEKVDRVKKIDSLREVMRRYPDAKKICFSTYVDEYVDIPEPSGSTDLTQALKFIKSNYSTYKRIVLVSDGEPNNRKHAKEAASELSLPIDIIFIGKKGDEGERFMEELALTTNGQHFVV